MGDPLSRAGLRAFEEELLKEAGFADVARGAGKFMLRRLEAPRKFGLEAAGKVGRFTKGLFRGTEEAGARTFNPIAGMRRGWAGMAPTKELAERLPEGVTDAAAHLAKLKAPVSKLEQAFEAAKAQHGRFSPAARKAKDALNEARAPVKEFLQGGEHLVAPNVGMDVLKAKGLGGKLRAGAEELSRRGWTGAGDITKYMPVGQKGMIAGMGAMSIPHVAGANKPTRTGSGGALERGLGLAGSTAGMVLGGGLGLVPALALWYGAEQAGSKGGRVLDRLRAGASPREALTAPTPEEAQEQLETIYRTYG